MKTYPFKPDWTIPPGDLIRERLEDMGLSLTEFARRMKRPTSQMSRLLGGKIGLTVQTALQLERVLLPPAEHWLKLEMTHRLFLARKKAKALGKKR